MEPPGETPSLPNYPQLFLPPLAPLITSFQVDPLAIPGQQCDQHQPASPSGIDWKTLFFPGTSPLISEQEPPLQQYHDHGGCLDAAPPGATEYADVDGRKDGRKDKGKGATGRMKKVNRPRFAFQTRSPDDVLDDGYRWRKYGQKAVKNSTHPSYYRCIHHTCNVKKQVQRWHKDPSIVVTTYEGMHNHPCEKLMETLSPLLKQMQFLTRF